jgi:hypothetical protein
MSFQDTPTILNLPNQTGSIPTTTLLNVGPNGAGMYAVWADVIVTTAGSAGTVTISINWNNATTFASLFSPTFALNTVGEQAALLGNFYSTFSQPITYSTTVSGATGNPIYTLYLRLEYLG